MRPVRSFVITACALVPLAIAPAAVAASPRPWSDTASGDFTSPAGQRCPFTLSGTVLSDRERVRTVSTYDDGTPRTQEVVGQLVMRFTNEDSGQSVDRNLTGTGTFTMRPDGSLAELALLGGHFAAGLPPGSPQGPAYLVFTGAGHSVSFAPDGTRTVTFGDGPVENLCTTLAG